MIRRTIGVGLSLAGVACALTLVFLSMRAVMDVGGFCAEGGPFQIDQHCPQGVPGILIGSIWGGVILAFVYIFLAVGGGIPSFAALLWPALFLSLAGTSSTTRSARQSRAVASFGDGWCAASSSCSWAGCRSSSPFR